MGDAMTRIEPDSWGDGPGFGEFLRRAEAEVLPKMLATEVVCSIVPGKPAGDLKFALETGLAVALGKPLILVAFDDRDIPEKLEKVADDIIVLTGPFNAALVNELLLLSMDKLAAKGVIK
jgi:hypothetical protein